jgi:peptidylprolyl isomerase
MVTTTGKYGADPQAGFPTPLVATKPQVHVITKGDSKKVLEPGQTAAVQVSVYNAATGELIATTVSEDGSSNGLTYNTGEGGLPAFASIAECLPVGSRVAAAGPAGKILGGELILAGNFPLEEKDTVVVIADLLDTYLGRANGADQLPQNGLPSIVLAPDGRPGFTFPSTDPPKDLRIATLKAGSGAKVKEGDKVVIEYSGIVWGEKKTFNTTWNVNQPALLPVVSMDADAPDSGGLVPGFAKAIVGSRVGSQVLVVIPPEFGYPAGSGPSDVPDGSTMVFVFDVLGIVP